MCCNNKDTFTMFILMVSTITTLCIFLLTLFGFDGDGHDSFNLLQRLLRNQEVKYLMVMLAVKSWK